MTNNMKHFLLKFNTILIIACALTIALYTVTLEASDDNVIIAIKRTGFVADSLNGVDAIYRPGSNDGGSSTYSCAAFVKKYYKAVYGVTPNNLFHNSTPKVSNDTFKKTQDPQIGDIAAMSTSSTSTHWAIVKEVGTTSVTLIEQNWKWSEGGRYVTKINRTVPISNLTFYRLSSVNNASGQGDIVEVKSNSFEPISNTPEYEELD